MDGLTLSISVIGVVGTIAGAILGARLGGKYVKESVFLAAEINRKGDQEKEQREIKNLRKALLVEIETLMVRYMEGIGEKLEAHPSTEPFYMIYPAYQRYFVVFEENAHLIGKIPDDKERELVVQCYNIAKGLLDSYKMNNNMAEKMNFAVGLGPVVLGANYKPVATEIERVMRLYTPVLKKMHTDALALYFALRESLKRDISWH